MKQIVDDLFAQIEPRSQNVSSDFFEMLRFSDETTIKSREATPSQHCIEHVSQTMACRSSDLAVLDQVRATAIAA